MNIIPVFYACDGAFVKYTVVSMHSMIKNASKDACVSCCYDFFCFFNVFFDREVRTVEHYRRESCFDTFVAVIV